MMTPSKGRHGIGARKHATPGTVHVRPHTESHGSPSGRSSFIGAVTGILDTAVARAKTVGQRLPRARVLLLGGGVLAVVAAVFVTVVLLLPSRSVRVPDLIGVPRAEASDRATALGLTLQVRDTPFSPTIAKDSVAAQEPSAGLLVAPGSVVIVDLSAGSESFALPDVIGMDLETARTQLRALGLTVTFDTAVSDASSGTIIASRPSAGTSVSKGDGVLVTLATSVGAIANSDLTGVGFVLDPAPPTSGDASDVGLDVATRVSALLSAAGAHVTMTRTSTDTSGGPTPAERAALARETSAAVLIGLDVAPSSLEGMVLRTMPPTGGSDQARELSGPLADAILASLRSDVSTVTTLSASGDAVVTDSGLPGVRLTLGSFASQSDAASFADEHWLEVVSNDIYRALAQLYGRQ